MINRVESNPPYSVILISDPKGGEIPQSLNGSAIAATDSCIGVGCRAEMDGATRITLGAKREVDPGEAPTFVGKLETPSHKVVVRTVEGVMLLELSVPKQVAAVAIWLNNLREPDQVIVGVE